MKLVVSVFFIVFQLTNAFTSEYKYDYGVDTGYVIYTKDGSIPLLQYLTEIPIAVPPGVVVTHVRVLVYATSPPKVEYDDTYKKVSIQYSWAQVCMSKFRIIVKGIER